MRTVLVVRAIVVDKHGRVGHYATTCLDSPSIKRRWRDEECGFRVRAFVLAVCVRGLHAGFRRRTSGFETEFLWHALTVNSEGLPGINQRASVQACGLLGSQKAGQQLSDSLGQKKQF